MQEWFQMLEPKKIGMKSSNFKRDLTEDGTASISAGYLKTLRGGNNPAEPFFAEIMIKDKLIMALTDSGNSFHLISGTYYKQLVEPSYIIVCKKIIEKNIIKYNNEKKPIK